MLETRNLTKRYKPKKGVAVEALKDVSLKFPEKGMVFLLGKSGSGKSTLLNLLGGLDKYDGGEIIINGVSSKDFKQKHFDSYRNTYLGFIFQEYNILEEFNVGANIAMAIELQGRKATDEEINKILQEVDLEGYGNRKPNELSGGQKQRVAIARALVKNPKIIMADEPTGALDSNTGKQVLDTLRKLSKDKLVIVVSHDREFAEKYADRIIELADGEVISDVEYDKDECQDVEAFGISFESNQILVAKGYHLTEEDRRHINEHLQAMSADVASISLAAARSGGRSFRKTDQSKINSAKGGEFKLIKSKLPLKSTVKIGANGLKYKKFRLVITILLSCVAFGLFGLADTMGSYNHIRTCTESLMDSDITYASVNKARRVEFDDYSYYDSWGMKINENDLKTIESETGVKMKGVYVPFEAYMSFYENTGYDTESISGFDIYPTYLTGFANVSEDELNEMNYDVVCGKMPDGSKNEIGVSTTLCQTFIDHGYSDGSLTNGKKNITDINDYSDMVGRSLDIEGKKYTITCVFDTDFDFDRYMDLAEEPENLTTAQELLRYALYQELSYAQGYSLEQVAIVGDGFIEKRLENEPKVKPVTNWIDFHVESGNNYIYLSPTYVTELKDVNQDDIIWVGEKKEVLKDKEILVTAQMLSYNFYTDNGDMMPLEDCIAELSKIGSGFSTYSEDETEDSGYSVVGVLNGEVTGDIVVGSKSLIEKITDVESGIYEYAVGIMPESEGDVKNLVSFCYREDADVRYEMMNAVTYELDMINSSFEDMSEVFFYIGLGFAAFAALMLANFISTSISYKKQEIGILRAIGARSNDVFKIFFAESLIIAAINFVLSATGVAVVTAIINYYLRNDIGIYITILNFGIRQIVLLMAVSAFIALAASFIPVKRIAAKNPIDAIRNR